MTNEVDQKAAFEPPLGCGVRLLVEKNGNLYECQPGPGMWKCGSCMRGVILGAWETKCRVCGATVQQPND